MNNSLLICGGSGLLGSSFIKILHKKFDIIHATYLNKKIDNNLNINYHKINFLSEIEIKKLLLKIKPFIVINCVGLADVDYCQNNPKKAHKLNFITLKNLSNLLDPKTKLIHISTDQLFSDKKKFHSESSETKPINTYAKTKLLADKYLLKNRKNSLIIRTNFYGHSSDHKESYSEKIYSSLKKNENLYLSDEIYFNPINTIDLVNLTYKILKKNVSGIFNISSDVPISKYKFGKLISKKFNASYGIVLGILILHLMIVRDFAQLRVGLAINITLYAYFINNRIKYVLYVFAGTIHFSCLVLAGLLISYKIFMNSKRFYIKCIPFIGVVVLGSSLSILSQLDPRIELYMNYDRAGYGQPVSNFNQLFFVVYFLVFSIISTDVNKSLFIYSFALAFLIFLSFSSVSIFSYRLTNVALSLYPYFMIRISGVTLRTMHQNNQRSFGL